MRAYQSHRHRAIVFGLSIIIFGVANAGRPIGFGNLIKNGGFFPNGAKGFLLSLTFVTFAFGGVELLGITAGETENPEKTIPKAINSVFYRILIFYAIVFPVRFSGRGRSQPTETERGCCKTASHKKAGAATLKGVGSSGFLL